MSLTFRLLYGIGWTPWNRDTVGQPLRKLVDGWPATHSPSVLDLGCGVGTDSVFLASHGWAATGVDIVPRALQAARRRAAAAGVEVRWVRANVNRLLELEIGHGFDLVLDIGCFHGLSDRDRERCATAVTAITVPGSRLFLFAFPPGRRPAHRGISADQLLHHYGAGWRLTFATPDPESRFGSLKPTWYCLSRV
ncbi:MAG: class I SAM-dependent methyltransferase [Candidatus Dormibacteria bacterium]